jgi:dTDP-4-dehydrorhamnose reductase
MDVTIIGANGQLGSFFSRKYPNANKLTRKDIDLSKPDSVRETLNKYPADVIYNCAAYTDVNGAELLADKNKEEDECWAVNCYSTHEIAMAANDMGARLYHFSTDYVFDGANIGTSRREIPYKENDKTSPRNYYGMQKLRGEEAVWQVCQDYAIIRTCGLYSPDHSNFVNNIIKKALVSTEISVVDDQICTPTCVETLSEIDKIENIGIYHLTDAGHCSWYELADAIVLLSGIKCDVYGISTSNYQKDINPFDAKRPQYSVLDCSKIIKECGITQFHWLVNLKSHLRYMRDYHGLPISKEL